MKKSSKQILFERMHKIGGMPLNENTNTYFDTQSGAVEAAIEDARKKGFEVNDEDIPQQFLDGWVGYENNKSASMPIYKNGKEQRKALQISIYRMPSGKYELTHYIN
jgi:hypothetical protein